MAGGSWEASLVGALVALNPIYLGFVLAFPNSRTGFFLLSHKKKKNLIYQYKWEKEFLINFELPWKLFKRHSVVGCAFDIRK